MSATEPVPVLPHLRRQRRRQGHARGRSPEGFIFLGHKSTLHTLRAVGSAKTIAFPLPAGISPLDFEKSDRAVGRCSGQL